MTKTEFFLKIIYGMYNFLFTKKFQVFFINFQNYKYESDDKGHHNGTPQKSSFGSSLLNHNSSKQITKNNFLFVFTLLLLPLIKSSSLLCY